MYGYRHIQSTRNTVIIIMHNEGLGDTGPNDGSLTANVGTCTWIYASKCSLSEHHLRKCLS